MAIKKGPTKGSGGKHRNKLKGYGPTPKAEDRVYHKAYKAKKAAERRQMADPRLAAAVEWTSSLRRILRIWCTAVIPCWKHCA
mgnify:CR=1 FL=1